MFIDDYTYSVKLYLLPYILPIIHVALLGSIYSTVALAAERYITICHPFMRYRSYYRGTTFILPVVLFAFLYTLPKFFELRLSWEPLRNMSTLSMNESTAEIPMFRAKLMATDMRKDKTYIRVYLICMNFLVQIVIPFAVLIGFNWLTYRTMKESEKTLLQNIRVHYQSNRNRTSTIRNNSENSTTNENITIQSSTNGGSSQNGNQAISTKNKATSLRKREVILSRISIYIVFVFLFCHSVRIVPNIYEMVCTYTKPDKKPLAFPPWVLAFTHLSHLLVTFACSANFYIYFAKYGSRSIFKRNQNERISQRNPTCINRSEGDRTRSQYQTSRLEVEHNGATSTTTLFKNKSSPNLFSNRRGV